MKTDDLKKSLTHVLDSLQTYLTYGMPDNLSLSHRLSQLSKPSVSCLGELSDGEMAVLDNTIHTLSIFLAQHINDGVGDADVDQAIELHFACQQFVSANWKDKGQALLQRQDRLANRKRNPGQYHLSELYLCWMDTEGMAQKLIDTFVTPNTESEETEEPQTKTFIVEVIQRYSQAMKVDVQVTPEMSSFDAEQAALRAIADGAGTEMGEPVFHSECDSNFWTAYTEEDWNRTE